MLGPRSLYEEELKNEKCVVLCVDAGSNTSRCIYQHQQRNPLEHKVP
jgi:hypothetical protein